MDVVMALTVGMLASLRRLLQTIRRVRSSRGTERAVHSRQCTGGADSSMLSVEINGSLD